MDYTDVATLLSKWVFTRFDYGIEDSDLGSFLEQYPEHVAGACFEWSLHAVGRYSPDSTSRSSLEEDYDFYLLTLALTDFAAAIRLPSDGLWQLFWQSSSDRGKPCLFFFERPPRQKLSAKISRELYERADRELRHIGRTGDGFQKLKGTNQSSPKANSIVANESYNCVSWGDDEFTFKTGAQANCIKVMYDVWFIGVRWMDQHEILAKAEADGVRLRDKFRDHLAWKKMIVPHPETSGFFGLADPPSEKKI